MKENNNATINGFNSARYKRMAIIFVVLSLLNMFAVLMAFRRSGYGLYHAEDALSHVARINHYVQEAGGTAVQVERYQGAVLHRGGGAAVAAQLSAHEAAMIFDIVALGFRHGRVFSHSFRGTDSC